MIDTNSKSINMEGIKIVRKETGVSINTPESAGLMVDALAFGDPETITMMKDYFNISYDDFVHSDTLAKIKYIYNASKDFSGNMYEFLLKTGRQAGIKRFSTERSLDKLHAYLQTKSITKQAEQRLKLLKTELTNFAKNA